MYAYSYKFSRDIIFKVLRSTDHPRNFILEISLAKLWLVSIGEQNQGVSNQSKLPTRFINLKIFRDFKDLEKREYTVNNIFSLGATHTEWIAS